MCIIGEVVNLTDTCNCIEAEVKKKSVIIFDLYGTLVDWKHNIGSFIEFYVSKEAVNDFFECDIREVHSYRPYKEILGKCLVEVSEKHGVLVGGDIIDSFILTFSKSPPFPDTIYGLRVLRKHGFRTAVLSNSDKDIVNITLHGFRELFDYIITAEDTKAYKPMEKAFLRAYEAMNIEPVQAIHVSAYPQYDLEPASRMGAATVLLDRGLGYSWPLKVRSILELTMVLSNIE